MGKKEIEPKQTNKQTENMMQLAEASLIVRVVMANTVCLRGDTAVHSEI